MGYPSNRQTHAEGRGLQWPSSAMWGGFMGSPLKSLTPGGTKGGSVGPLPGVPKRHVVGIEHGARERG